MESEEDPPEAVELHEAKLGPCTVSLIDYVATGQKVALDGSIVLAPRSISSSQPSIYISDGEVLLTDLCAELIAQGMKAEYRYVIIKICFEFVKRFVFSNKFTVHILGTLGLL